MKGKIESGILLILVFVITLAILWGLLAITTKIPNSAICDNMTRSAYSFKEKKAFSFSENERFSEISDNFADAILLGVAWNMGESGTLDTKYYSGGEYGESVGLYLSVTEGAKPDTDYTRYWHGNAGVARLFHLFGNIEEMKLISTVAAILLFVAALVLLIKKRCTITGICLVFALLSVNVWNIRLSLEYQPVFIVAGLMCLLFVSFENKGLRTLAVLSVIGGVMTAFFDFLTCETLPILLPLALFLAMRIEQGRGESLRKNLRIIIICAAAFFVAYAATFAAKWILASIVTGENKILLAASSAGVRIGGEDSAGFLSGIPANLSVLFGGCVRIDTVRVVTGTLLSLAVLASAFYLIKKKKCDGHGLISLLILGSVVILRYAALQNHSYLHAFFTFRALATVVFSLLACTLLAGREKK